MEEAQDLIIQSAAHVEQSVIPLAEALIPESMPQLQTPPHCKSCHTCLAQLWISVTT
ncbi:hypothetical protein PAAG_11965 [Paracoccidioides lutzii Pb01]|uniref:Uncharacterized protein n=1 Tax=Paracoccidioides lutzii (strain ATCC MYA-826 / Pb01) TaxID=502779 RepID=A0A0A2VK71_PARBA|nr:hypothetical protein PAAG_11965 [Paracoccidioides lutzii Pb01]KGQ01289.1 hypothetical protein PAAG_11965 [Paracoccidioides lutzii Pb01]